MAPEAVTGRLTCLDRRKSGHLTVPARPYSCFLQPERGSSLRGDVLNLEPHERPNLHHALTVRRSDFTKCPAARASDVSTRQCAGVRVAEMWLIEQVFGFATNLEREALRELEDSSKAGIQLPKPWPSEPRIQTMDIADAGGRGVGHEGRGVEPHREPRGIIRASEVLNRGDMVRRLWCVKSRQNVDVLPDQQWIAREGGENTI